MVDESGYKIGKTNPKLVAGLDFSVCLRKLYLVQEVVEWKILCSYLGGKNLMNVFGSSGHPKKFA
jgi:hypothetical protein